MRLAIAYSLILLLTSFSTQAADVATFTLTPDELKSKLNAVITADTNAGPADVIYRCAKKGVDQVCSFKDSGFQRSVNGFKELNIANGRFTKAVRLEITTANGKVAEIRLKGSRRDPMNLFDFLSNVVNTARIFDSNVGVEDGSLKTFTDELGLMRGDNADDIGKSRMIIEPYAQISCLAIDSHISSDVACVFVPRS